MCSADFPLGGDEKAGDEVYCACCGSPGKLTGSPDSDDCEVEEDF